MNCLRSIPAKQEVPSELANLDRWHAWRMIDGRKVPIDASGRTVDHVKARTSFDVAVAIANQYGGGLGLSIDNQADGTDIVFIDLDGCRDPDGALKQWAHPIVERFAETYSQISASGTGIHILCRGKWSAGFTKVEFGGDHHNAQVFDTKRFVAMTGAADPKPVKAAQDALDWVAEYLAGFLYEKPPRARQADFGASDAGSTPKVAGSGLRTAGDWPTIRSRALAYLDRVEPAVSGQGGHDRTLAAAMKVVGGFDLTEAEAFEVLSQWNERCEPPWKEAELRRKITEAMKFTADRGSLLRASTDRYEKRIEPASLPVWKEGQPYPEIDLDVLGHTRIRPFPIDRLPEPLGKIAQAAATSMRAHVDLVAVSMLAVLGAAIGRSYKLHIRDDWFSWPSAWYALVSPVGFGKSPSIRFAERELKRIDADLVAQSEARKTSWEAECEGLNKGDPKPPEPPALRARLRSSTMPAMIDCHRQNLLGFLLSPDELTNWFVGMGEFSKGNSTDRTNWLSARTGGDLSQDRVSGGMRYLPESAITVLGGIPPGELGKILDGSGDGLLERLLFAYPDIFQRPDPPKLLDQTSELCPEWDIIVRRTFAYRIDANAEFRTEPIVLRLTDDGDAAEAFHAFECRMNRLLNEEPAPPLAGFYSKIPHDVAHWAMTLAMVDSVLNSWPNPKPVIRAFHVEAAVAIADYFLDGASKAIESAGGLRRNDRKVIRKIVKDRAEEIDRTWLNSVFSGKNRPEPSVLDSILVRLIEARIFLERTSSGKWRVNPKAWELKL